MYVIYHTSGAINNYLSGRTKPHILRQVIPRLSVQVRAKRAWQGLLIVEIGYSEKCVAAAAAAVSARALPTAEWKLERELLTPSRAEHLMWAPNVRGKGNEKNKEKTSRPFSRLRGGGIDVAPKEVRAIGSDRWRSTATVYSWIFMPRERVREKRRCDASRSRS